MWCRCAREPMPRAKPRVEQRTGTYHPHIWRCRQDIAEALGVDAKCQALQEAADIVGRAIAAESKYVTLCKRQGAPRHVILKDTIRHLRRIFTETYVGKSWGRIARENEFIARCLIDARLSKRRKAESPLADTGIWHHLKTSRQSSALPPPIWRRGPGRQKAIETIAVRVVREKLTK
jgi:hypothetical protein